MKKLLLAVACGLLFASCAETTNKETSEEIEAPAVQSRLNDVSWILGEWQLSSPDGGVFVEKWIKESDSSYTGEGSLTNAKGEVLFAESLRLVQRGNELWYVPTIASQNNGQPVYFKEKSFTGNEIVFENPEHDFPQRIIYQKSSDSTLYARIEGKQDGKDAKEEYSYSRKAQ
jgi:hypothetical protein